MESGVALQKIYADYNYFGVCLSLEYLTLDEYMELWEIKHNWMKLHMCKIMQKIVLKTGVRFIMLIVYNCQICCIGKNHHLVVL